MLQTEQKNYIQNLHVGDIRMAWNQNANVVFYYRLK